MTKRLKWLAIVVVVVLGLGILKDLAIKMVVTVVATQITGAPVQIRGLSVGIFRPSVRISGFRIHNPAGFPRGVMVDLPVVRLEYDLGALLQRRLHLTYAEVHLAELGLVRNAEGRLNADALRVAKGGGGDPQGGPPAPPMPMRIDTLQLTMDRVVVKDYSVGREPAIQVYDINLDKRYSNITSAQQLAVLILVEPMKAAGIRGAAIYGAALLTGVEFLPVVAAVTLTGRDSVEQVLEAGQDRVFDAAVRVLTRMGSITGRSQSDGVIHAAVQGAGVTVKLRRRSEHATSVTISARKYLIPKPAVANGVLYELTREL